MQLIWRRPDGSFVALVEGFPYHVIPSDPLWPLAVEAADALGDDLLLEPEPEQPTAEEALAAWRARAVLTRIQFALQAVADGKMTAAEAEAWVGSGTIPALGETALLLIADTALRTAARIRFAGAVFIARNDPFLPALQAAAEWTDAQVDDFFIAGAVL
jgi:hypothetical protein